MTRRSFGNALWLAGMLAASTVGATQPVLTRHPDLWLEAELEPAQVYVQAQAIYRLRFYQAVDVRDLQINAPSARLADLRPIGSERVHEVLRDGRRLRVRERSYAVFPFGSGPLELSGAHALGRIAAKPGAGTAAPDGRQALRLQAPPQTLTVRPAPTAIDGPWLPAHALTMTENWSTPATGVQPGQALRRSIRIEALGVDAGQIPSLHVSAPGMQVEAEAPRLENRSQGELNIGVREQVFRMVALRAGDLTVPALRLHWWNLATDTPAVATLPARALHVAPTEAAPVRLQNLPAFLLAAAALLAAGLALAYGWRARWRGAWRLQRACRCADAGAVRDGLLQWAAGLWPQAPPLSLEALAQRLSDPAARQALAALERGLYGPKTAPCDAAVLATAVRAVKGARPARY